MKKTLISLCAVAALLFTGCGSETTTVSSSAPESIEFVSTEYIELIKDSSLEITAAVDILIDAGFEVGTIIIENNSIPDDILTKAFDVLISKGGSTKIAVDKTFDDITSLTSEIEAIDVVGEEFQEIEDGFVKMSTAYTELYTFVTEPAGTHNEYALTFKDVTSNFITIANESAALLP